MIILKLRRACPVHGQKISEKIPQDAAAADPVSLNAMQLRKAET